MSQTTAVLYNPASYLGMLSDLSDNDIVSYAAEGAIAVNKCVRLGTNREKQVAQSGTGVGQGALVWGFALHDHARELNSAGLSQYASTEAVSVLRRGKMWVETNDAVVAGAVANLHLASGKLTDEVVAAGIEAITLLSVRFLTATSGAGLAVIEVK
jgi:hypothetical protein